MQEDARKEEVRRVMKVKRIKREYLDWNKSEEEDKKREREENKTKITMKKNEKYS